MTIEQVEDLARQLIPVPTGGLIVTQTIQTGEHTRPPVIRWSISHFKPHNCNQCTMGHGTTPLEALSRLVQLLTPCDSSTPSA
jgi:hypothetical protein